MSTNNFYFNNILLIDDSDTVDDDMEYIKDEINTTLNRYYKDFVERPDDIESDELRSYPSSMIGTIDFTDKWQVEIVLRSGYYGGINLDYTIVKLDKNYFECNEYNDDIVDGIPDYIQKKLKTLEKILSSICYFKEASKIGQFSNGEALYQWN